MLYLVNARIARNRTLGRVGAAALAAALCLPPSSAWGQLASNSSVHVVVKTVEIRDLKCEKRRFKMESTRATGRLFPYMTKRMGSRDWDPRPAVMGTVAIIVMIPMVVLAVPFDLIAAPFRGECDFTAKMDGELVEWVGTNNLDAKLTAKGVNVLRKGVQRVAEPLLFESDAGTVSDGQGRFSISLPGHVGRSKDFDVHWKIEGKPAGAARLTLEGKRVGFSQLDEAFGSPVIPDPPRIILPKKS